MAEKRNKATTTQHVARIPQPHGGAITPFSSTHQPQNKSAGGLMRGALTDMAECTRSELKAVVEDEAQPVYRVAAAARLLLATVDGADFDRVVNHTNGSPIQRSENETINRHIRVIELPADDAHN